MTPEPWTRVPLRQLVLSVSSGVSVNSIGRPRLPGEIGVLKTSAVTSGMFKPDENKAVLAEELGRARGNPRAGAILVSRMNTLNLVGASAYVDRDRPDLVLPDRLWQLEVDPQRVDGRWLHQFLLAPSTRVRISDMAGGTSDSMKNISKEKFFALDVLLPPLAEQRRIAASLLAVDHVVEATEAALHQVKCVARAMAEELPIRGLPHRHTRYSPSMFGEVPSSWQQRAIVDVCEQVRNPVKVDQEASYIEIGVRSHGKGLFHKEPIRGSDLGAKKVFWIEPGCVVVNIVFAWEGAVATTREAERGMIASHRFPMFKPRSESLDVDYLRLILQTHRGTELLGAISPGGAGRNKTLNQESFKRLVVPVPALAEQKLIAEAVKSAEERAVAEEHAIGRLRSLKAALVSSLLKPEVPAMAAAGDS